MTYGSVMAAIGRVTAAVKPWFLLLGLALAAAAAAKVLGYSPPLVRAGLTDLAIAAALCLYAGR